MTRFGTVCLAAIAFAALTVCVFSHAEAHKGATGVVKDRMELMKKLGKNAKTIDLMMAGKIGYEAGAFKAAVAAMKSHSGDAMTRLFPKDSLQHPTEATAKIWADWDKFKAEANRLHAYADALEWIAKNNAQAVSTEGRGSAFGAGPPEQADGYPANETVRHLPPHMIFNYMKKMCRTCHDTFRTQKP